VDVFRGYRSVPAWPGAAVAIGNFDGVHLGHRALIDRVRALATGDARAVVLTFDPHPSAVLSPSNAPAKLCSLDRRLELIAAAGADAVVVEPFTKELAALAPDAFVDDIVLGALNARVIVVGYDFNYGAGRAGTTEALRAHGARKGVAVDVVAAVAAGGEVASSTKIRGLLRAGDVAGAARLLGRWWDVEGVVVHGAKRGRAIGVPTANVLPDHPLLVLPGIYAVLLELDGQRLPAVASLGTNPTFVDGGALVLEVHVLDWEGDLYDRRVRIAFVARLRGEEKFASVDALIAQIRRDIADARGPLQQAVTAPRP